MKSWLGILLLGAMSGIAQADGINERNHPDPSAQAKINRVIAQAWATKQPPVDHTAVFRDLRATNGKGINLGISVGNVQASKNGQTPRENNVVTRDNIVICVHCQSQ